MPEQIDLVRRFAGALDREDYPAALGLLDAGCEYAIRGEVLRGPAAIIGSYQGNGDAASRDFEEITYGSSVRAGEDGWIVITFTDHIRHAGRLHDHVCEQWVRAAGGKIQRIEHRDLPGERERLGAFRREALGSPPAQRGNRSPR